MNCMKHLLASALLMAAATTVSAAVVNISWTGGGLTFSSSIDIGGRTGLIDNNDVTGLNGGTMTVTDGVDQGFFVPTNLDLSVSSFSFTVSGSTVTKTPGSSWLLTDSDSNNFLAGDVGSSTWALIGNGDLSPNLSNEADTLTLTVVPEPETYAAVAGAGLVAFGLFRRRVSKA